MTIHNDNYVAGDAITLDVFQDAPKVRSAGLPTAYARYGKRFLDISLVILALPVVLPVTLLFALLICCDGANPFFRQARLGQNGRIFTMWKLRSMVPNADKLLEKTLAKDANARREWNEKQKITNDPRVTRVGRWVRKSSIDELPQLINVLTGDMSLVGPRPMMLSQKVLYPGAAYYALRPGVSGPWQISKDRNTGSFASRADYDDDYLENLSFSNDVRIIAKTIGTVLRGTGH